MDTVYHISMFFNKSVPGLHFKQNQSRSSTIYHSQTMPFDQIWPDLGFLWVWGIIFQCFSTNLFQDFTLDKIYGFHQKSTLPRPCLLTRSGQTLDSYGYEGIIFQSFSKQFVRDFTSDKSMDFIKNLPSSDHAF